MSAEEVILTTKGPIGSLSELIGTSEPALRLLLSVLAGYPLAIIHRKFLFDKPPTVQHLYFALTGFALGYFNYGWEALHTVLAVLFTYLTVLLLGATSISIAVIFLFNMLYLLTGYYYAGTDSYDINWTMPQCVLVLRLLGVGFDLYDGRQPFDTLSSERKKVALVKRPSPLEFFGYALFPGSYMIGPQFPMKRYQRFIGNEFRDKNHPDEPPQSVPAAVTRFSLGLFYLLVFQLLGLLVSDDMFYSSRFGELNFLKRLGLLGIWGRYTLYKYISCWLFSEGGCILFGISHNGEDERGQTRWDGVENVKLSVFENTTEFNHYIQSFNTNTNHWVAEYVYKRLKFLGNRQLSQLGVLLFLAIWHGLHSGYYVCFGFEFIVIYMERDFKSIVSSNETLTAFFAHSSVKTACHLLLRLYTFVFMGWCLLPFALLKFDRYWAAFANVNYVGIVLFVLWPVVYGPLLRLIFKKKKKKEADD